MRKAEEEFEEERWKKRGRIVNIRDEKKEVDGEPPRWLTDPLRKHRTRQPKGDKRDGGSYD